MIETEHVGLAHLDQLHILSLILQELRGISQQPMEAIVSDRAAPSARLSKLRAKAHTTLRHLSSHPGTDDLTFIKALDELVNQIDSTLVHHAEAQGPAFDRYSQAILALNRFHMFVGDHFELLLDPQRDSYFNMTLVVWEVPLLLEDVARARGLGTRIAGRRQYSDDEIYQLMHFRQNYEDRITAIRGAVDGLTRRQHHHHDFHDIHQSFNRVRRACDTLSRAMMLNIPTHAFKLNSDEYFQIGTQAIDEISDLFVDASNTLRSLLKSRQTDLSRDQWLTSGLFVLVFMTMLLTFASSVLRVYRRSQKDRWKATLEHAKSTMFETQGIKATCDSGLSQICTEFSALEGILFIFNDQNEKLYLGATYATVVGRRATVLNLGESMVGQVAKDCLGRVHTVERAQMALQPGTHAHAEVTLVAETTMPLMHDDTLIGVAQLMLRAPLTAARTKALSALCNLVALHLHQKTRLSKSMNLLRLIDKHIITSETNERGVIISTSDALTKLSGYSRSELVGQTYRLMQHPDTAPQLYTNLWETIQRGEVWHGEIKNQKKNGDAFWVDTTISPNMDYYGHLIGYTAIQQDITDRKRVQQLAIRDSLTNLYNRRHLNEVFDDMARFARREARLLVFAMLDVDHFKLYNDTYGHQRGDEALKAIAQVLESRMRRPGDVVFRLGGEEFGLLFYSQDQEAAVDYAEKVRASIGDLGIEHTRNSAAQHVTVSMGIFISAPDLQLTQDEIYKHADDALYRAKEHGRDQLAYNKALDENT